ncbi:DUF29 family protein [Argonema antarcticum]|uniref:DUF29 family protein n=1 Tax=Argonema antarcticum TaxID=2942763 RepID=UPI002012B558|nr:DUF29 family protein [Argonema antarcticum]MCL1473072.1 DUF29 family protein [Argonema antarcticum A004/B2]
MTQELIDLRNCIEEGRYADALSIVDDLEGMSKKGILRNIRSFLVRMIIHLIKNQIEQRLTNSWAASISDSIIEIQDLNLQDNKVSHYLKPDEWESILVKALETAIRQASAEVLNGKLSPYQLSERVDRIQIIAISQQFLALTYEHSDETLPAIIDEYLTQLPGGENWKEGRQ